MKRHLIYSVEIDGRVGAMDTLGQVSPDGYFIQPMVYSSGSNGNCKTVRSLSSAQSLNPSRKRSAESYCMF